MSQPSLACTQDFSTVISGGAETYKKKKIIRHRIINSKKKINSYFLIYTRLINMKRVEGILKKKKKIM